MGVVPEKREDLPLTPGPYLGALSQGFGAQKDLALGVLVFVPHTLIHALDHQGCYLGHPLAPTLGQAGRAWGGPVPLSPVSLCLGRQYLLAFALSFSRWLCAHPELYRLPVTLSPAEPVAPGDLITKGSLVSGAVCLGKRGVGGLACGSCGAQGSSTLTEAKRRQPMGVGSSCECDGVVLRVLAPLPRLTPSGLGRGRETQF